MDRILVDFDIASLIVVQLSLLLGFGLFGLFKLTCFLDRINCLKTEQLLMMYANVYSSNLPKDFSKNRDLMDLLGDLIDNNHQTSRKMEKIQLTTIGSMNLIHFGKSKKFSKDLYAGFIAPTLKQSLYAETWTNGNGGRLDSECEYKYKVYNIKDIQIPEKKSFFSTRDHSKWVITQSESSPFVCIGDINRMESQFKRGGGSLCISQPKVWKRFHETIKKYEKCDQY